MTKLVLDPERSRIRLRTFAEGLFARLAHDLELECRGISGTAEHVGDETGSATLTVPIEKIDVSGTLKHGHVDPNGLSASDREDCLGKMRRDVFHTNVGVVTVEASVERGKARIRVVPPNGRSVERSIAIRLEAAGATIRLSGTLDVSVSALGGGVVKGPMNAFRVKDGVEVLFDVVFAAP